MPRWKSPPVDGRVSISTPQVIEELKSRPGMWKLVKVYEQRHGAYNYASSARRGRSQFKPASDWEFRAVMNELYVRYIGEKE